MLTARIQAWDYLRDLLVRSPSHSQAHPEAAGKLAGVRISADRGIASSRLKSGKAERVDHTASDPRFYTGVDRPAGDTTRSILATPLTARGETVGAIEAINHR